MGKILCHIAIYIIYEIFSRVRHKNPKKIPWNGKYRDFQEMPKKHMYVHFGNLSTLNRQEPNRNSPAGTKGVQFALLFQ